MKEDGDTAKINRGTNQSGMRAYNERLVLSLVRRSDALAKSDMARITGLSAQTVSVITRALEKDGLLSKGEPQRGKVGQPSVPMYLKGEGAFFFGLKIGRRSTELVLIDFSGEVVASSKTRYDYPTPKRILKFFEVESTKMRNLLSADHRSRISGTGVAMPFELWNWAGVIGAPVDEMILWRDTDLREELRRITGHEVLIQNDATAACGAELVFGEGNMPRDFLYFYIGFFVGGGVVLNGSIYSGSSGNAGAIGSMLVPCHDGMLRQLVTQASIFSLETRIKIDGGDPLLIWDDVKDWQIAAHIVDPWIAEVSGALAYAIAGASSIIDFSAALIDGWLPPEVRGRIVEETSAALAKLDTAGVTVPKVQEGSVGETARSLGAASLPLSERFMVDQNSL